MTHPALIPLLARDGSVRGYTIVDDGDLPFLNGWTWSLAGPGYAMRRHKGGTTYMHRALLGLEPGDTREGDHINRCKLDNRRSNLRIVEGQQNSHNVTPRSGTSSEHRGVCWNRRRKKWMAYGIVDGRQRFLGHFDVEADAAECAQQWRAQNLSHYVEDVA